VYRQDVAAVPPEGRRRWVSRGLACLLLLSTVALAGPLAGPPSPELRLVSTTDPAPPTGVTSTGVDGGLTISWTAPLEAFIVRYDVYVDGVLRASPTTTSTSVNGLVNGQSYAITVRTYTSFVGTTYPGSATSAPVSGIPRDSVAPAAPTGVAAVRGDGVVTLSWTANSGDADADGYRVLRDGVDRSGLLAGRGTTAWADPTVVNDTTYSYTVETHDTSGNWSVSSSPAATATPTDLTAPAAPTGVVGGRGDARAGLSWTANAEPDVANYLVLRNGVEVATVTGTSYLDLGLSNDTSYSYTVVAVDGHGNRSAPSSAVVVTPTDLTPPGAPTGLAAVRGDGQASLSWTANPETDLASYRVLRNGVEIATVTGSTAYDDPGLTNDTTYTYALVAVDTHGNRSVSSSPVSATPTDLGAPAAPTGLVATRGDQQVALTWTANPEGDLATYRVLRDGVEVATVTGTSYTDPGLTNDTTYGYTLVAVDTHGNRSVPSASAPATPTDLTPPAAPAGLVASAGDGQVTLAWTANPEPDLATYRVLRDGVEVATVTGTSYPDTGLTNGVSYSYRLVAVDTHGNRSVASAAAPATPRDLIAPSAPTGLVATRGDGQVALTWTANPEPDLATYRVLRDGVEVATVTGTSCTDSGLTNDATYTYRLVAVDASGNRSAQSSPVSATPTDLTPPAAPTGLSATRSNKKVALTWAAGGEPDLATYRVLRDGLEIATVAGTSYTDTGRTNGVTYTYTLVAVDTHGNRSPESAPLLAGPVDLTPPAVPSGLAAAHGDGQVSLTWTANPEPDLASYGVLRNGVQIATVIGTAWTDTGLTNDTIYGYTLVALDTNGNRSAESSPVTATPTDLTPPAAPSGVLATAGEGKVTLSWTANAEPDLATYRVLRDGVEVATVNGTDSGLTNDTTYGYTVVAVDTHGNRSAASAVAAATPRDPAPAPPTGLTAAPGDRRAVLSWTAPADQDVVGYRVLREDGTTATTTTASTTSVAVTGLPNGTTYRFTVLAVDAGGHVSAPSEQVAVAPVSPTVPLTGAGESGGITASGDGRFVVVGTRGQREASDTNTAYELYLIDRTAGTAKRIAPLPASSTSTTDPTNTATPAISDDGRYVVLATTAGLVPADTNGLSDVYRLDTSTGTKSLVSVPAGGAVNGSTAGAVVQPGSSVYSTGPPVVVSADGDLVLFYSARSDLVAGDTNGFVDLFAKRLSTGVVTRVSTTAAGVSLPGAATGPALALTPDGRFALFPANTATGATLLYRKTLSGAGAGDLLLVSKVTASGLTTPFAVYRDTGDVAISDDGRYVALVTAARITTTSPATSNSTGLAYRLDTTTGAALAFGDGQTTAWEHQVELDPSGRYGFYATIAAALPADGNFHTDHYRRDLAGGAAGPLVLVTSDADGAPVSGPAGSIAPSEYGRLLAVTGDLVIVTTSQALVSGDSNRVRDLYLKDLVSGTASSPVG
jgi:chitodextrinase